MTRKRRSTLTASLLIVALISPMIFFERRIERYHCCAQSESDVLINTPLDGLLVDFKPTFVVTSQRPGETFGYDALDGIYTRHGIPIFIGWLGGLVVPVVALWFAVRLIRLKSN